MFNNMVPKSNSKGFNHSTSVLGWNNPVFKVKVIIGFIPSVPVKATFMEWTIPNVSFIVVLICNRLITNAKSDINTIQSSLLIYDTINQILSFWLFYFRVGDSCYFVCWLALQTTTGWHLPLSCTISWQCHKNGIALSALQLFPFPFSCLITKRLI